MKSVWNPLGLRSWRAPGRALLLAGTCFFLFEGKAPAQEVPALPGKTADQLERKTPAPDVLPQPGKMADQYLTPPKPEQVFRLESEATLLERMAREAQVGDNPLGLRYQFVLPNYPPSLPAGSLEERPWEPLPEIVEPAYLCYGRLYFEQINQERYGWDLGLLQPLISTGIFYFDLAMLPYHAATDPLRRYECNTGYALPGDPMPLLMYLPEPSLTGLLAEATAVGLMFVIFP